MKSHVHPTALGPTGPAIYSDANPGRHFHATKQGHTSLDIVEGDSHTHTIGKDGCWKLDAPITRRDAQIRLSRGY